MKTIYDFVNTNKKVQKYKPKSIRNKGFENLKNEELRFELENCEKTKYNPWKHLKLTSLGYKSIYKLDSLGKRRWSNYFNSGGKVYIISYSHNQPLYKRILFDKKIKKYIGNDVPLPLKPKQKRRSYTKGGRDGKVLGFNFYFIEDKKMLPKNRRDLLSKSEHYIGIISDEQSRYGIENIDKDITFLDPNLTDLEIAEQWNLFFQKYGYRFREFEMQWNKLYLINTEEDSHIGNNIENNENEVLELRNKLNRLFKKTVCDFG